MRSFVNLTLIAGTLAFASLACESEYSLDTTGSRLSAARSKSQADVDATEDEDASDADSRSGSGSAERFRPAAASPTSAALTVTFGKGISTSIGKKALRECADRGSAREKATFYDATGIALTLAYAPAKPIAYVASDAPAADGTTIDQLKRSLGDTGKLSFLVDPQDLSTQPTVYALAAYGPGFGSRERCANPGLPLIDGDIEKFPEGCGIVGYVEAYRDSSGKVIASAASQFLWGSNPTQSRDTSFTAPPNGWGCDDYDSPLVLDLSPGLDGLSLSADTGDVFDLDGDGAADRIAWVTSKDTPFLALDANGNGVVDGIDELFGNRTKSPLGLRESESGFEALAAWDANADGVIDATDPVWSKLRLWFDRNHDGKTDPGELATLEAHGIRSISVAHTSVNEELFAGGEVRGAVRQRGAAFGENGRAVPVMDLWFRYR